MPTIIACSGPLRVSAAQPATKFGVKRRNSRDQTKPSYQPQKWQSTKSNPHATHEQKLAAASTEQLMLMMIMMMVMIVAMC